MDASTIIAGVTGFITALAVLALLLREGRPGTFLDGIYPETIGHYNRRTQQRHGVSRSTRLFVRRPCLETIGGDRRFQSCDRCIFLAQLVDWSRGGLAFTLLKSKEFRPTVGETLAVKSEHFRRTALKVIVQNITEEPDCWRVGCKFAVELKARHLRAAFGGAK